MTASTIKLTAIEKSYPGVKSLDKVDFSVLPGEIHALLGENGAGKSTLTRVMGGATSPDAGTIDYLGKQVAWHSPRQARNAGIHVIHQELALFPELSVAENILMDHQPRGWSGLIDRRASVKRAEAVLARLGVNISARALAGDLTVADQQMVEIAKALVGDVRVIIFDEPTAVISGQEVDILFENMRRLRSEGVAIVYISHRLEEIFEIADRVTVLKDGRLVGTKSVAEMDRDGLIHMMVGRQFEDIYPPRPQSSAEQRVLLSVSHLASGKRVRDVSLELHEGEILGVAGMVGAGRTEFAQAVFGSARIDSGTIEVDGISLANRSPSASIQAGIGFLTEDRKAEGLFQQLSIASNIVAPALGQVTRGGIVDRNAETAIAKEQIRNFAIAASSPHLRVVNLSGGNQQKVLFSRWARIADKVLILDEPTRGVDVGAKVEIYRIIRSLADRGIGILLISSELPEVIGLSDRIVVMAEGRITGELRGAEMTEQRVMALATVSHLRARPAGLDAAHQKEVAQ